MYIPPEELKNATELTRAGRLMEATRAIQRALGGADPDTAPSAPTQPARTAADAVDVPFRELPGSTPTQAQPTGARPAHFDSHRFTSPSGACNYRLYVPARADDTPLPVVVMLHGCTQDASDFAAGTAMNEEAERRGCIVVYPEQPARANSMRCWNWFEPAHQQRGRGEPAMLAALARDVVQRHHGDPQRVYVTGLSAGGAMAAVLGEAYPDVFAAIGVHSGLPAGSATDVASAQQAMRKGSRKGHAVKSGGRAVPTIVFHGSADRTVHPANGRELVASAAAAASAAGLALQREEQRSTIGGRIVTRVVYQDPQQQAPQVEYWELAGAGHAWVGGKPAGSHTDSTGPAASAAMLDFFLGHRLDADRGTT